MVDAAFGHPRLAAIYDQLDPDRGDLDAYLAMAEEFGARSVLDIGCGTGVFALLLAERGIAVTGIDPARASVDVARGKPGAERVRWLDGDAGDLPPPAGRPGDDDRERRPGDHRSAGVAPDAARRVRGAAARRAARLRDARPGAAGVGGVGGVERARPRTA